MARMIEKLQAILVAVLASTALALLLSPDTIAEESEVRTWTDASGKFKVQGRLLEVVDGNVILESKQGKSIKIPVKKLSKADQDVLNGGGDNPFQEMESGSSSLNENNSQKTSEKTTSESDSGAPASGDWRGPAPEIDWDSVTEITAEDADWNVPIVEAENVEGLKRGMLPSYSNIHERAVGLAAQWPSRRVTIGYVHDFPNPQPLSRIVQVDLKSGKAVVSEQVPANMQPVGMLEDGSGVLMAGRADADKESPTSEGSSTLKIWRVNGKKVKSSRAWSPLPPGPPDAFNRVAKGRIVMAEGVGNDLLVVASDKGQVAAFQLSSREPKWQMKAEANAGTVALSPDRKSIAVLSGKTVLVVDIASGKVLGSKSLDNTSLGNAVHNAFPAIAWSPTGAKIAVCNASGVFVLSTKDGEWVHEIITRLPPSGGDLGFPDENFVLVKNELLIHLPTQIQVCNYTDATFVKTVGPASITVVQPLGNAGVVVASTMPHPKALEILKIAQNDPETLPVHPGVNFSVDVSGVQGALQEKAKSGMMKSLEASGFKFNDSAPLKLNITTTGPVSKTVTYFRLGDRQFNEYTTTVNITYQGTKLWTMSNTNQPFVLVSEKNESPEAALDRLGKQPSVDFLASMQLPKYLQRPAANAPANQWHNALMSAKFTPKGLE